ncbi:glycosyltransferase family 9 protein [Xanthomonas arboricola]|nr:glycosyltransferase family 9 protein [Xanthomonas arboricola]
MISSGRALSRSWRHTLRHAASLSQYLTRSVPPVLRRREGCGGHDADRMPVRASGTRRAHVNASTGRGSMNRRLADAALLAYARLLRRFERVPAATAQVERVVIFSALGPGLRAGDHIAASIAFELVARRFPGAELHLVTTAFQAGKFHDLYLLHMPIDRLIVCDDPAFGRWRNWLRLLRGLRAARYDACVHDSRDTRLSPLFAHLCGIGRRFGLQRGLAVDAFVNQGQIALSGAWGAMTLLDMAQAYARALAFDPPLPRERIDPRFRLAPVDRPLAFSGRRPIIVVHPGGSRDWNRRWPDAHYQVLCEQLLRRYHAQIVLVGGDDESDEAQQLVDRVRERCSDGELRQACGGDLNWMAQHVAQADLVVGNDSSVMHIAGCLGVPAVIMFGPTPYSTWDAYRNQTSVSLELDCWRHRPTLHRDAVAACSRDCPVEYDPALRRYPHCMTGLSVEAVFDACERKLAAGGRRDGRDASSVAGTAADPA